MHALLVSALLAAPALAQPVSYAVDLSRAREQVVTVTMTLTGLTPDERGRHTAVVRLPVWRPGLYSVLDQAGAIRTVAPAKPGHTLTKIDKSSWRLDAGPDAEASFTYDLLATTLENRTRHADDTHAFLDPSTILMYTDERRNLPHVVTLTLPQAPGSPGSSPWTVACGLPVIREGSAVTATIAAPSYDVLADSPIEAGLHHTVGFDVDGVPHQIVLWGGEPSLEDSALKRFGAPPAGHWDDLPRDLAAITRVQRGLFGSLPYDRYTFFIHAYPGGRGGTEHLNSCVLQTGNEFLRDDERYRSFLILASHELFHTWNVKRFRPRELAPYDYQRENLTTLLWVAEGTTSYYDSLLVVRAGLRSRRQHLDHLASSITAHDTRLGSAVQPLADSSYDAWIKFTKRSADAANSTVSFYDKGALASFVLDMLIRRANPAASLDDVMRGLYARFPDGTKGYTEDDLRAVIAEAAGCSPEAAWLAGFFKDTVHGVARPDFEAALAVVGYELRPGEGKPKAYAGFTLADEAGVTKVTAVATDSPALKADQGLVVGDVVAALDRHRLTAATLDRELAKRSPGEAVTLTIFRNEVMRDVTFTLADKPDVRLSIRAVDTPTPEQTRQAESWLGAGSR